MYTGTMDAEPAFVDTNVLVYASRALAPMHHVAFASLQRAREKERPLWLSRQILREYLAVVTRPQFQFPALDATAARTDVENFMRDFNIAEEGPQVTTALLDVLMRHRCSGKQVHDANIVATMLTHGLRRLLTFNTADFLRFAGLVELEPLPP